MPAWALVAAAAIGPSVVSPEYEALLRQYARGEREAAVAALGDWEPRDVDRQIRAMVRAARGAAGCAACPDPVDERLTKAAVMLHLDRDGADRPPAAGQEQPRACPGLDARRARDLAHLLAVRAETRDFARRVFLAMAQSCQWDFCLADAVEWGREGLSRFPGDALLLLGVGSTLEENATLGRAPLAMEDAPRDRRAPRARVNPLGERAQGFAAAERVLAEAVSADPDLVEARLRLGRVQWRQGKDEVALRTLEEALRRRGPPPLPYLAHLFAGQVQEGAGRVAEAQRHFEEALALEPESQAAAIALSHLRRMSGDLAGARRLLSDGLSYAGSRGDRDPYWNYVASNAATAPEIFRALREEASE
jgi:tetratricopeptide (TPR) repeat protein